MKILVVYPYIPWPLDRGTFQRTFHLLRALAAEHEVDLFALSENGEGMEHRAVFEQFCRRVTFVRFEHPQWAGLLRGRLLNPLPSNIAHWSDGGVRAALERQLAETRYDHVHLCDIALAQYFADSGRRERISVDRSRVDLQFQLMEHRSLGFPLRTRLLRMESYAKLWFYERRMARRARLQVVCGPDDERFVRRYIRRDTNVAVVGNGVDLGYFHPASVNTARAAEPTVLFCGAMDYSPNVDALRWYFSEIHERLRERIPGLRVLLVGKSPGAEVLGHGRLPGVTVTGTVPDVRPYYRRAWVQIVPLRIGGGTRLKIPESMAMGTPVVSTTIGAQGLDLGSGKDVLLADTAGEFAAATARALTDHALRSRLTEEGLKTVRERFSWQTLGRQFCELFKTHLP